MGTEPPALVGPLLAAVRERYPDLAVWSVRLATNGQNHTVLIVNESVVFRFPRYTAGVAAMRAETALLRAIRDRVPLAIPYPTYGDDGDVPADRAFVGYALLPGTPLWRSAFAALPGNTQRAVAGQLAAFLHTLHTIPVAVLPARLLVADRRDGWAAMYQRVRDQLFPYMRPDARDAVRHHFATFLDTPGHFAWRPALRHGDFGPSNILYDPAESVVTGILDFSEAALGDPAVDIAALAGYGTTFREAFTDAYPEARAWEVRMNFYAGTFTLQEALSGAEHNDPEAFRHGIASYT